MEPNEERQPRLWPRRIPLRSACSWTPTRIISFENAHLHVRANTIKGRIRRARAPGFISWCSIPRTQRGSLLQTLLDTAGSSASVCRWPVWFGGPGGGLLWLRCCLEPGLDLIYRDMCLGYSQSSLVGAKTAAALLPAHLESRLSGSAERLPPSLPSSLHTSIHPSLCLSCFTRLPPHTPLHHVHPPPPSSICLAAKAGLKFKIFSHFFFAPSRFLYFCLSVPSVFSL